MKTAIKGEKMEKLYGLDIVIVDDTPSSRDVVVEYLMITGHKIVEQFSNGNECVRRFEETPIVADTLITDYDMPGLNGIELIRKMNVLRPNMRKIMLTGREWIRNELKNDYPVIIKGEKQMFNKLSEQLLTFVKKQNKCLHN